jgi:hypothetical protein
MPELPGGAPVFVDPTGRRLRTVRMAAVLGAFALLGVTGLIVAALLGAPLGQLNPLPEPVSGPAAVEPIPARQAEPPGDGTSTTSTAKPGRGVVPTTTTTTTPPAAPTTTTTTAKGNKPATRPGRPTDLPTPPGHTR